MFDKQADERLRLAHLEHKRDLYAQMLILMDDYRAASGRLVAATKAVSKVSVDAHDELRHELENSPQDASSIKELKAAEKAERELKSSLHAAVVNVQLVAPKKVRDSVLAFLNSVDEETKDPEAKELPTFRRRARGWKAREHYVEEVRNDLGLTP